MIFDSWGGVLADGAFQEFSLAYTKRVLAQLKRSHDGIVIPRIVFTKGGALWLDEMGGLDCDVLGLDWTANLAKARAMVGGEVGGAWQSFARQYRPERAVCHPSGDSSGSR